MDPEDPGWGYQLMTAVIRAYRGHRLGLLLKIAMMDLLATTEPGLEGSRPGTPGATST